MCQLALWQERLPMARLSQPETVIVAVIIALPKPFREEKPFLAV